MVSKVVFGNIVQSMVVSLLNKFTIIYSIVVLLTLVIWVLQTSDGQNTKIHCFHCNIQSKFRCHFLNLLYNYCSLVSLSWRNNTQEMAGCFHSVYSWEVTNFINLTVSSLSICLMFRNMKKYLFMIFLPHNVRMPDSAEGTQVQTQLLKYQSFDNFVPPHYHSSLSCKWVPRQLWKCERKIFAQ